MMVSSEHHTTVQSRINLSSAFFERSSRTPLFPLLLEHAPVPPYLHLIFTKKNLSVLNECILFSKVNQRQ